MRRDALKTLTVQIAARDYDRLMRGMDPSPRVVRIVEGRGLQRRSRPVPDLLNPHWVARVQRDRERLIQQAISADAGGGEK